MDAAVLLARHRATFRALGAAVVPDLANASAADWAGIETTVSRALDARPAKMHRQLALLLRAIALLSRVRFGRSLGRVELDRRERLLLSLQHSPLGLVRRGVWGVRTLILMGHYSRPAVMSAIGYRADARGWSARREHAQSMRPETDTP